MRSKNKKENKLKLKKHYSKNTVVESIPPTPEELIKIIKLEEYNKHNSVVNNIPIKKTKKKLEYIKLNQILLSDYDAMTGGELFKVARIIPYKYFKCFEEENYFNYIKKDISLKTTKITISPIPNNKNNTTNKTATVTTTFGSINAGNPGMVNISAGSVGCGMVKDGDQNSYEWEFLHEGDILVFLKKRFDKFGNVYPSWLISKKKNPGECFVRVIPILHGAYRLEKIIYR